MSGLGGWCRGFIKGSGVSGASGASGAGGAGQAEIQRLRDVEILAGYLERVKQTPGAAGADAVGGHGLEDLIQERDEGGAAVEGGKVEQGLLGARGPETSIRRFVGAFPGLRPPRRTQPWANFLRSLRELRWRQTGGRVGRAIGCRTMINDALQPHLEGKAPTFEETLRRIVREEMKAAG